MNSSIAIIIPGVVLTLLSCSTIGKSPAGTLEAGIEKKSVSDISFFGEVSYDTTIIKKDKSRMTLLWNSRTLEAIIFQKGKSGKFSSFQFTKRPLYNLLTTQREGGRYTHFDTLIFFKDRCYYKTIGKYIKPGIRTSWSGTTVFLSYHYKQDSLIRFIQTFHFRDSALGLQGIDEYIRNHNPDSAPLSGQRIPIPINNAERSKMVFFREYITSSL